MENPAQVQNKAACQFFTFGNLSLITVITHVTIEIMLPIPSVYNIKKNITENSWGNTSNFANASGYVMKTKKNCENSVFWGIL